MRLLRLTQTFISSWMRIGKIIGIEIWNAQKSGLIKQVAKPIAKATQ